MNATLAVLCTVLGTLSAVIIDMLGGWDLQLQTLILFILIDYVLGLYLAIKKKSAKTVSGGLSSEVSFSRLVKKFLLMFVVIIVCVRLDLLLGLDIIETAAMMCFIINEAISILENCALAGLPIPEKVIKILDVMEKDNNKQ